MLIGFHYGEVLYLKKAGQSALLTLFRLIPTFTHYAKLLPQFKMIQWTIGESTREVYLGFRNECCLIASALENLGAFKLCNLHFASTTTSLRLSVLGTTFAQVVAGRFSGYGCLRSAWIQLSFFFPAFPTRHYTIWKPHSLPFVFSQLIKIANQRILASKIVQYSVRSSYFRWISSALASDLSTGAVNYY